MRGASVTWWLRRRDHRRDRPDRVGVRDVAQQVPEDRRRDEDVDREADAEQIVRCELIFGREVTRAFGGLPFSR